MKPERSLKPIQKELEVEDNLANSEMKEEERVTNMEKIQSKGALFSFAGSCIGREQADVAAKFKGHGG